jgi:hypothetical protein
MTISLISLPSILRRALNLATFFSAGFAFATNQPLPAYIASEVPAEGQENTMDENGFWKVVQRVHDESGGDMDRKCDALRQQVSALPKDDALAFAQHFDAMMDKAYSWLLWGAAYVLNGGCSDDGFTDFRSMLISRGREAFERALSDPDSLAEEVFDESDWLYEGYEYAVTDGVEAAAGHRPHRTMPPQPSGTKWQEDEVYGLFPKLSTKYG